VPICHTEELAFSNNCIDYNVIRSVYISESIAT